MTYLSLFKFRKFPLGWLHWHTCRVVHIVELIVAVGGDGRGGDGIVSPSAVLISIVPGSRMILLLLDLSCEHDNLFYEASVLL